MNLKILIMLVCFFNLSGSFHLQVFMWLMLLVAWCTYISLTLIPLIINQVMCQFHVQFNLHEFLLKWRSLNGTKKFFGRMKLLANWWNNSNLKKLSQFTKILSNLSIIRLHNFAPNTHNFVPNTQFTTHLDNLDFEQHQCEYFWLFLVFWEACLIQTKACLILQISVLDPTNQCFRSNSLG